MLKINRRAFAAGSAALALAPRVAGADDKKTLRFVQNGNLTILDPIWTTAYVTRDHGYMIYDTLFATDESNAVKPQMVDKHEVSADKLTWTFTLRDGLEWHDGKPVVAEDCVASLKRWGARDPMGQKLMDFVAELKALNDKTFTMRLKEPYGLVLDTLGKPSSNVPFMMPKRIADTDPFKQIDSQVGSGPFIYVNAESKPGERHVYIRNPKYKPRAEPASALAGGKIAKVERVEFVDMPDPQQQVNALIAGEIDMVEQVPHDLIPILKADKGVQIVDWNPLGQQFVIRFNHLTKPFDNPKIRLAALYCMRQEDYLKATVGEPQYYKVCTAAFVCGTPNGVEIKGDLLTKPDFEKSKALLKEAGYDGSPVVLMQSTTLPVLTNMAPVTKALLEQGGFKVDMQSMDWQTVVTRRAKKDPADKGGWSAFHTYAIAA
ncbi:MAG TPA: ABC transporter substrate-binding protein, partial [Reyranella sp.]|nr:ABC transporter substrate-binding protein [Reyranella sp.]